MRVILLDSMDRRIGTVKTYDRCQVIRHAGAYFVRTQKTERLRPDHPETAIVFEQAEIFVHEHLEPPT